MVCRSSAVGKVTFNLKEEAVQLRFGQRISALHFQRILRRQHHEGFVHAMRLARHRDVLFLHGFEQRALRLGRGAVDLVGQQDVGEHRTGLELETFPAVLVLADDVRADDVRLGMRSGVNCTRENFRFTASASVRTSIVLPRPGTPSSRTCPAAKNATSTPSMISAWPTIMRASSLRTRLKRSRNCSTCCWESAVVMEGVRWVNE